MSKVPEPWVGLITEYKNMPEIKQIKMDQNPTIEEMGADAFLKQKFDLPKWIDEPIPGEPQTFKEASQEFESLKTEIGFENIDGAMEVLDSGNKEKVLAFAKKELKDRPDLQEAMRRMAKYL